MRKDEDHRAVAPGGSGGAGAAVARARVGAAEAGELAAGGPVLARAGHAAAAAADELDGLRLLGPAGPPGHRLGLGHSHLGGRRLAWLGRFGP